MKISNKSKPPFILKPGLNKKVYTFPEDYCTLKEYGRLVKEQAKELEDYDNHDCHRSPEDSCEACEMMWAKAFER